MNSILGIDGIDQSLIYLATVGKRNGRSEEHDRE
jgi:hypothetical protein